MALSAGSTPSATYCATTARVRRRSSSGSWATVIACRSTTQNSASYSCCNRTHCCTAPSTFPR
ncbi:Uncharacterised protein [Mycobacteroides abscessus subsp. abscessus]|nr:Uncharacterised protein [Mycobacteroides abscessus subsp. abscessus]